MPEQTNVRQNLDRLFDAELQFKDLVAVTTSGAAQVSGSDKIIDTGGGFFEGDMVIDITAMDVATGDEVYNIHVQGSSSATFSSGLASIIKFECGDATQIASDVDITTGRFILPFNNQVGETIYQYLRVFTTLDAASSSITYEANAVQR